jgi:ABC-type uncharacterized transport system substrate-binding protein
MIKLLGGLILFITSVFAHPHTFIDTYFKINAKNNIISNLHIQWKFDIMTSQLLLMEFDKNGDQIFDKKELSYIELVYFLPLKDYNYYMDIKYNQTLVNFIPYNFNAFLEKNLQLVYEFDIKIDRPKEKLQIDIYDEEMFTAFMVKKEFINSAVPFQLKGIDNDFYFSHRISF